MAGGPPNRRVIDASRWTASNTLAMCRSARSSILKAVSEHSNGNRADAGAKAPEERQFRVGSDFFLRGRSWGWGAPDVILLHGLASNARIWDGVAGRLAQDGVSALALDLRSHGRSDSPPTGYDFKTLAADLDAVLCQSGAVQPVVVGHSWGAHVALQHAVDGEHHVSGLVLVDGGYLDYRVVPGMKADEAEAKLAPVRWSMPIETWLQSGWLGPQIETVGGWVRGFLEASVVVDADGVARPRLPFETHLLIAHELVNQEPRKLFADLSIPFSLCVATREDLPFPKAPAVELVRSVASGGIFCSHDDVSHDIPLFQPIRLAEEILSFRSQVISAELT
jgi:pimeloyl-ACP methyl ester carboxylesterase